MQTGVNREGDTCLTLPAAHTPSLALHRPGPWWPWSYASGCTSTAPWQKLSCPAMFTHLTIGTAAVTACLPCGSGFICRGPISCCGIHTVLYLPPSRSGLWGSVLWFKLCGCCGCCLIAHRSSRRGSASLLGMVGTRPSGCRSLLRPGPVHWARHHYCWPGTPFET